MANAEKYKTVVERAEAFKEFCSGRRCDECQLRGIASGSTRYIIDCSFAWLDLEAKDETLPCPFCGMNTVVKSYVTVRHVDNHLVECTHCQYRSEEKFQRDAAIAAHNRVARAVMAEGKKEEK